MHLPCFAGFKNADSICSFTAVKPRPPQPCKWQQNVSIIIRSVIDYYYFIETITMVIFLSFQANAVYDTEHAESIQKGRQHIQPSANGYLVAPGIAPGKLFWRQSSFCCILALKCSLGLQITNSCCFKLCNYCLEYYLRTG